MYVACFRIGIRPNEFWDMTLDEVFLLLEANRPMTAGDYQGNLTGGKVEELMERSELSDEEWVKSNAA